MKKILVLLVALIAINTYSQETTSQDVKLDTIELVGIRADKTTPVSQITVTQAEIQQGYVGQEMNYILEKTPSITTYSDNGTQTGYTYFRLRGIDQTRINMTLNGVPLNEPEDQGVYFSNYPNFATNVKSFQIQRGVGTSTNGTASFGGSVNYESNFGLEKQTEFELGYGSWNTSMGNFKYGSGLSKNGKWSGYFNLSGFNTDGYRYHSGGKGYLGFVGVQYLGDTETVKLTAFSGGSNNQMTWYGVSEEDIENDPRTNYNSPDADDNFKQTLVMTEYTKRFNTTNKISGTVFYNRLDGDWDLLDGDMLNFGLYSNFYGLIGNYNTKPKDFDINVGISTNFYDRHHSMVVLPDTDLKIYSNVGNKNEYSTYGKVKYNLGKFTLFGDLQYRYVTFVYDGYVPMDDQTWSFFNPKGGLTYTINPNINIYGSIGQSHREPTRSDMFGGWDDLIEFVAVTPEEVVDYEVGINYNKNTVNFQGNLYYMDFNNEITLLGSLGEYSLQNFGNVDKSFRSGIEINGSWVIHDEVTMKFNGTYSYNRIKDQGVEFSPLYTPNVIQNISFNFHKDEFMFELSGRHQSKSYIDFSNENTLDAFFTTDMLIGITLKKFDIKVKGVNLLGAEYFTNGYMIEDTKYLYTNSPISVFGTVTYKL